jgi:hypothetical protein
MAIASRICVLGRWPGLHVSELQRPAALGALYAHCGVDRPGRTGNASPSEIKPFDKRVDKLHRVFGPTQSSIASGNSRAWHRLDVPQFCCGSQGHRRCRLRRRAAHRPPVALLAVREHAHRRSRDVEDQCRGAMIKGPPPRGGYLAGGRRRSVARRRPGASRRAPQRAKAAGRRRRDRQ